MQLLFAQLQPCFRSPSAEPGLPIAMKATTGAKKQKRAVQLLFAQLQPCFRLPSAEPGLPIAIKVMMNVKQPHLHIRRLKWSCNTTLSEIHAKELLTMKDTTKYVGLDVPKEKISLPLPIQEGNLPGISGSSHIVRKRSGDVFIDEATKAVGSLREFKGCGKFERVLESSREFGQFGMNRNGPKRLRKGGSARNRRCTPPVPGLARHQAKTEPPASLLR